MPQSRGPVVGKVKKDEKMMVEGTVASLVDFEQELLWSKIYAIGGHPRDYMSFKIKGPNDVSYSCEVAFRGYPVGMEIGDKVRVEGDATHQEIGPITLNTINDCKIVDRQPGPARQATIAGVIGGKEDFPGDIQIGDGPSVGFKIRADGKTYSCFVKKALPEFRDYRIGDKVSVWGVLQQPDAEKLDRCRVVSHSVADEH